MVGSSDPSLPSERCREACRQGPGRLHRGKRDCPRAARRSATASLLVAVRAQNGIPSVNYDRGLVFDTAVLAVQYALSGQGIALCDANLFADEIRAGRLVKPFAAVLDDGYGYYLITQP